LGAITGPVAAAPEAEQDGVLASVQEAERAEALDHLRTHRKFVTSATQHPEQTVIQYRSQSSVARDGARRGVCQHRRNHNRRSMNMARVAGVILIWRPIEQIFDFVADERNEPRYNPQIVRVAQLTDAPIGGPDAVPRGTEEGRPGDADDGRVHRYDRPRHLPSVTRSSIMETE
jgi:hypothetical protein